MNRENNFDFLRIFAAALVLFSHSFPLFGRQPEPIGWATGYLEGGGFAVSIFFVVSGFLVGASLINKPNIGDYFVSRALRILPGLCVVVLLCAFVVGPIFTTVDLNTYFSSPEPWVYLGNALIFPIHFTLPHVFESHPHPNSLNGSLWTLPIEVVMYLLLVPLSLTGVLTRRLGLFLPVIFYCAFVMGVNWFQLGWENRGPIIFGAVDTFNFLRLGVYFFAGTALYLYRDIVKVDVRLALAAVALLVCTVHTPVGTTAAAVAIPYLVYYIAFCNLPLRKLTSYTGDISYGFYIYAFPVQQCVFELSNGSVGFWGMMAMSFALTTLFAYLSWVLIERPALALKPRGQPDSAPRLAVAP